MKERGLITSKVNTHTHTHTPCGNGDWQVFQLPDLEDKDFRIRGLSCQKTKTPVIWYNLRDVWEQPFV